MSYVSFQSNIILKFSRIHKDSDDTHGYQLIDQNTCDAIYNAVTPYISNRANLLYTEPQVTIEVTLI